MPHENLAYAEVMSERAAGNNNLSKLIKDASVIPTRATKYRKLISSTEKNTKSGKPSTTDSLAKYVEENKGIYTRAIL